MEWYFLRLQNYEFIMIAFWSCFIFVVLMAETENYGWVYVHMVCGDMYKSYMGHGIQQH